MHELLYMLITLMFFYVLYTLAGQNRSKWQAIPIKQNRTQQPVVPQDAVLRRHYLTQLRHEIEAGLSAKPSDSVLRRHHETLVAARLAERLK